MARRIDFAVGVPAVAVLSACHRQRDFPPAVKNIGLICLGAIGDLILSVGSAIPALRQKYPSALITVFTSASNRNFMSLLPDADDVIDIPLKNLARAIRSIRKSRCDLLIDFSPWPRIGALLSALSGAGYTMGFSTHRQFRHYAYDRVVLHRADVHEFENNAALLRIAGCEEVKRPQISPIAAGNGSLAEMMRSLSPYVVFHPWAAGFYNEMREWPAEYWCGLARLILEKGYHIVITGGPDDAAAAQILLDKMETISGKIYNACGKHSLFDTAFIIQNSSAMVSVNTGPMHLAAALDVPLVALHGPTNPVRWRPLSEKSINIMPQKGAHGYLDLGFEYPKNVEPCMQHISVDQVWKALEPMLKFDKR